MLQTSSHRIDLVSAQLEPANLETGSSLTCSLAELTRARAAHGAAVNDVAAAQDKLLQAEKALEKDWGRDWEWKKLEGTCIELDTGE